jgi:hypothetical protein
VDPKTSTFPGDEQDWIMNMIMIEEYIHRVYYNPFEEVGAYTHHDKIRSEVELVGMQEDHISRGFDARDKHDQVLSLIRQRNFNEEPDDEFSSYLDKKFELGPLRYRFIGFVPGAWHDQAVVNEHPYYTEKEEFNQVMYTDGNGMRALYMKPDARVIDEDGNGYPILEKPHHHTPCRFRGNETRRCYRQRPDVTDIINRQKKLKYLKPESFEEGVDDNRLIRQHLMDEDVGRIMGDDAFATADAITDHPNDWAMIDPEFTWGEGFDIDRVNEIFDIPPHQDWVGGRVRLLEEGEDDSGIEDNDDELEDDE